MPKFNTNKEVYKVYDEAMKKIAHDNDILNNITNTLKEIFFSGVTYIDSNGQKQTSPTIEPGTFKEYDEDELVKPILAKGHNTILECERRESSGEFLRWYAMYRGISSAELIELGKNPASQTSLETIKKLNSMKQEYIDLMNSEDTEKLSEFYM